jgi:hypothetical protein
MEIKHSQKQPINKEIKDYVFQFLMVFLAITGGFFMENLRENYIEQHREREYIESMVKDVKQDTLSLQKIITNCEQQIIGIDSLKLVLKSPVEEIDYRKMYNLTMKHINTLNSFTPNEITITQLKNSGGLRLIANKSASDSIVNYYTTYDSHIEQQNYALNFLKETLNLELVAMDFSAGNGINTSLSFDQSKFKEFYNRTLLFQSLLVTEVSWMKEYQKQSIALLNHLKKEYKLKT